MKKTWAYGGAGVVVLVALLAWAFAPRPVEVEAGAVTRGRFETTIDEDGKTRLRDRYVVSAPLAGVVERIALREGDPVEADAVVARLMPAMSPMLDERTLRQQRERVDGADAQVQRASVRIERARVALQQARNDMQRTEQLAQQGFVSPTQLETQRLVSLAAQKELDAAQQERHIAQHDAAQARAALSAVRAPQSGAAFAVRSPSAGRVLRVVQASEGPVAIGSPLLEVGDTAQLEVVAELLTTDALQARPGGLVRIERWGGPGELEGRVRRVEPSAFTKVSALGVEEQRVKVLIDLSSPPEQWRALGDGYRVGVRLVTLAMDDALRVPVGAVFPQAAPGEGDAPGGMAVFVIDGGRARLRPVEIGARNSTHAWVKKGLAEGDAVIVYPPTAVVDGGRVKSRSVTR